MSIFSGNATVSKAVVVSGSLAMGTGTVYLLYQLYTISKQLKRTSCQVAILTDRLYRAESDILQLRRDAELEHITEQAVASDDADDEFVDAEEESQGITSMSNGTILKKQLDKGLDSFFHDVDFKIETGGMENLSNCRRHLLEALKSHPHNAEIFWRISKVTYLLAEEEKSFGEPNETKRLDLMAYAKKAAEKSLNLNPKSGHPHKWIAVILGSLTQHMPAQEQIKNAFAIKEHAEAAIFYQPNDFLMHHIMGRWCYAVYMMSWMERKLASVLFATPPTATIEEAIAYLEKAESLGPLSSIANELYLAKSFIAKGNYSKAVKYLEAGEKLNCSSSEDKKAQEEILKLLEQYKSYSNGT